MTAIAIDWLQSLELQVRKKEEVQFAAIPLRD